MPDEKAMSVAEQDDALDFAVLDLLLYARPPGLWAIEEIAREIGDRAGAEDAVARLAGAGLIHRLREGFVFPSRAALRASQLAA